MSPGQSAENDHGPRGLCNPCYVHGSHAFGFGRFQGCEKEAKLILTKTGSRSLYQVVEIMEVADANAKNDAVLWAMEINAKNERRCSAYSTNIRFRVGVHPFYHAETISTMAIAIQIMNS